MSRAIVFSTLLPDPGDDARRQEILDLVAAASEFEAASDSGRMNPLRKLLADAYPEGAPKVLDCFAGGGAIPLEALRLGCDTTALELNPVAHLIERCTLQYPAQFGDKTPLGSDVLVDDFRRYAHRLGERLKHATTTLYPPGNSGVVPGMYLWSRTMTCQDPQCGREIPLMKSRWLARGRRRVWVDFVVQDKAVVTEVRDGDPPPGQDPSVGTVKASSVICPICRYSMGAKEIRRYGMTIGFGQRLVAVLEIDGRSRVYRNPEQGDLEAVARAKGLQESLAPCADGTSPLPDELCDEIGYRNLQNLLFGFSTWASLFNDRQLYVLGLLSQGVRQAYEEMLADGKTPDYARALATYLALGVDRVADYNSSFCIWNIQSEKIAHTFNFQAIPMVWDFAEINPFQNVSGNWFGAVKWVEEALTHCCLASRTPAQVVRGNAQRLPFEDGAFDAAVIDPPYYFSVMYADLSDYFYVWLKRSVGFLYPELFATELTPKDQEIIQNRVNPHNARYISSEEFERRLERALAELRRVVKKDGIVSIVFAHTDVEAWEHLLQALKRARLVPSASWPMRSESAKRPTALLSAVLGSSVVLACRPIEAETEGFYDDVVRELETRIAERLDRFERMGLVGADYFASAVGPAFEVFAKYSRVVRLSGEEVGVPELMTLARQVVARRAMGKLLGDESVNSLDPVSLMYLTWRWAYDGESIPADEAYKLERALDVDLSMMLGHDGLAEKVGSDFALRGPEERKGLTIGTSPLMIDVLHVACTLWDSGRRRELEQLLGDTGMGGSTAFWSLARALGEVLPEGNRERTMLLGLTGNQDALASAAAKVAQPGAEQQQIEWGGSEQKTLLETGPVQKRLGEE